MSALMVYAENHKGEYPNDLADLYPSYANYGVLAGLSGNVSKSKELLEGKKSINAVTSWRYMPGLKRDGQRLLIYDVTTSSDGGGKRLFTAGRYVGLSDGTVKRVPIAQWDSFLKQHTPDDRDE